MSSNTVVNLGEKLFLKGYRVVRPGLNPELEMGRFLTEEAHYANCVPVAGALEYFGNDDSVLTLALIQSYVSNQGSGWDFTLSYVERFLEESRTAGDELASELHGGYLALARTLGQRTGELHVALAKRTGNPAFEPEPMVAEDLVAWRERTTTELGQTMALLRERLPALPPAVQDDAQRLLDQEGALRARIETRGGVEAAGIKTRFHGDYHLGQVLVTGNDFIIIDFEGEPARTFDERRAKTSALRDVAGMLRSFNYARWSALKRVAQSTDELLRFDPVVRNWEQSTREAFLAGYDAAVAGSECPSATGSSLLGLFEIEKACYELRYELNNRVDWVQVPLHGMLAAVSVAPPAPAKDVVAATAEAGSETMPSASVAAVPATPPAPAPAANPPEAAEPPNHQPEEK